MGNGDHVVTGSAHNLTPASPISRLKVLEDSVHNSNRLHVDERGPLIAGRSHPELSQLLCIRVQGGLAQYGCQYAHSHQ